MFQAFQAIPWGVAKWSKAPVFDTGISEVRILPPQPTNKALVGAFFSRAIQRKTGPWYGGPVSSNWENRDAKRGGVEMSVPLFVALILAAGCEQAIAAA